MRARGTPDAQAHPQPRVQSKKAHERRRHGHAVCIRRSARGGAPACFVLSPVDGRSPVTVVSALLFLSGRRGKEQAGFRRTTRLGPARDGVVRRGGCPVRHGQRVNEDRLPGEAVSRIAVQRPAWFVRRRARRSHASGCCARPCGCVRAIRACALRPLLRPDAAAPPHPAPRIVTIAKRPSSTGRDILNIFLCCKMSSRQPG